jgi:hypothetical protein
MAVVITWSCPKFSETMLGVKAGLSRFRAMVEGSVAGEDEIPLDVRRHRDDISVIEEREGVETLLKRLEDLKGTVRVELDSIARDLDAESQDCEAMRVKYEHHFTQAPSSGLTKELRADLKSHLQALNAAAASDDQVQVLWNSAKGDVQLLISGDVEKVFRDCARGHDRRESLLDLDADKDDAEKEKISRLVEDIDERLGRLNKIERERDQTLKDLKEKIQTDDVSHLLLLNRRNPNVEPTIFASELEKFRPYQQRLSQAVHHQQSTIQETTQLWRALKDLAGRGEGARKWDERERRKKETVQRFNQASERYMEVRDGLAKGLQFYSELSGLTSTLRRNVKDYFSSRKTERDSLVAQAETQQRLAAQIVSSPPKPPPPPPPSSSLSQALSSLSLQNRQPPSNPLPPPGSWTPAQRSAFSGYPNYSPPATQSYPSPPPSVSHASPFIPPPPVQSPHAQASSRPSYSLAPPVQTPFGATPVPPQRDPYADLGSIGGSGHFPPPPPQRQSSYPLAVQPQSQTYHSHPPPVHAVYSYSAGAPHPPARQGSTGTALPPPPPPVSYSQPPPPQSYGVSARPHYGSSPSGQQQPYGGYGQYGR